MVLISTWMGSGQSSSEVVKESQSTIERPLTETVTSGAVDENGDIVDER